SSTGTSPHGQNVPDPENDGDNSYTGGNGAAVVTGALSNLIKVGADENLEFRFLRESTVVQKLTELGLTSHDDALRYDLKTEGGNQVRSEEHTSELQSRENLVCRLLLEKKSDVNSVCAGAV